LLKKNYESIEPASAPTVSQKAIIDDPSYHY